MTSLFDARAGLPASAVDDLQNAQRLALGPKTERVAVLGYWVADPTADDRDAERFGMLVRPRRGGPLHAPLRLAMFSNLRHDRQWQRIVPRLRAGMQVSVEPWNGELRLWFGPIETDVAAGREMYLSFGGHDPGPRQGLIVRAGPGRL